MPMHNFSSAAPAHRCLLVWRAHMNLQLVTQTAWSRYLLKDTLKVRAQPCLTQGTAPRTEAP